MNRTALSLLSRSILRGLTLIALLTPVSTVSFGGDPISAEPKKKRKAKRKKRKSYDRKQRQAKALMKEGHPTVELSIRTKPRVGARVYHGKELLGVAPFSFKWPKDTGSLDLVLKASGYITVNTRLYTYRDDKVTVDMFKETEAHKLFGYRKKVSTAKEDEGE